MSIFVIYSNCYSIGIHFVRFYVRNRNHQTFEFFKIKLLKNGKISIPAYSLQKLTYDEVAIAANDFNLTTKLNQAAGFQYGKIESELGALISRQTQNQAKSEQIKQLESKLDELLSDLTNTEANVAKLDKYSKDLEEAIKKHYCK